MPIDTLDPFLDARLLRHERTRLCDLIEARVMTRKPAAYLLNRVYIKGVPFYVDERVIVPRSLIGELLMTAFADDNALTGEPERIASVLDLCTGGGSLAILAARVFPNARIDAVDCSAGALDVARRNVEEHGLVDRVALKEGELFTPVKGVRYDLILANPPYVDAATIAEFPPEFAAEPRIAHAGGADGLDIVRRILTEAPAHLSPQGDARLRSRWWPRAAGARFPASCRSSGSTPRRRPAKCSSCARAISARESAFRSTGADRRALSFPTVAQRAIGNPERYPYLA